jgi:hypothetical protein
MVITQASVEDPAALYVRSGQKAKEAKAILDENSDDLASRIANKVISIIIPHAAEARL